MSILLRRRANPVNGANPVPESDVDITPMLDVVFIMLIFFVVTASFVKETGIGINKPANDGISEPSTPPIIVEISSANVIRIQNFEVSTAAIRSTIVRLRAETPDAAVVVRLDPNAKTQIMIAAVDGIRAANVEFPSVGLTGG
jgi:biopolymer transport protein ExbD